MKIWIAALAAVLIQPLVLIARLAPEYLASPQPLDGTWFMLNAVLIVATPVVLILGMPTFLILRKMSKDSWLSMASAGFILGALPIAVFWPSELKGYSAAQNWHGKHVSTYIDGIPTSYAWLTYGEEVFFMAIHGLIGALVFYTVVRRIELASGSIKHNHQINKSK
ncbi:hypothetical protein [Undibacterium flavidum]|uniref:Uncharacterized protein n=1 Tax=Undibacterium flavidum TaxID=2762297 RepID=A0ABR6YDP9_9BURK|nr:hypothetical protein [Undibacterium flavidum]MBC3874663.1 hypothetical protein [Undibacterium flavidum]